MEQAKILVLLLILVCGILALSQTADAAASCEYNGKTYGSGNRTINADSKCSKCTCTDGDFSCEKVESRKCRRVCNKVRCRKTNCANTTVDENLCCPKCVPAQPCDYMGLQFPDGETFESVDGCNTCQCSNGNVKCSKRGCKPCTVGEDEYASGEPVPADDNCNNCLCRNGLVTCTKMLCPGCRYNGTEYKSGDRFADEDGCNSCVCIRGKVKCGKQECYSSCTMIASVDFQAPKRPSLKIKHTTAGCNDTSGLRYKDGQVFTQTDGYNACKCKNGTITCTNYDCNVLNNRSCTVNGTIYGTGASFLGENGRSICSCFNTVVECLPLHCGPKTEGADYKEGKQLTENAGARMEESSAGTVNFPT